MIPFFWFIQCAFTLVVNEPDGDPKISHSPPPVDAKCLEDSTHSEEDVGILRTRELLAATAKFEPLNFDLADPNSWPEEAQNSARLMTLLDDRGQERLKSLDVPRYFAKDVSPRKRGEFFEFLGSLKGHPLHPCAKNRKPTRTGNMTEADILRCSPENFEKVNIYIIAVHRDISEVKNFPGESFNFFEILSPTTIDEWREMIRSHGGFPEEFNPFPVHELALSYVKQRFDYHIQESLIILGGAPVERASVTISMRTVGIGNVHVKLPFNVQITSLERYMSTIEVKGSLTGDLFLDTPNFRMLKDLSGGYLIEDANISYDATRFLSYLIRESPYEDENPIIPIATLLSTSLPEPPLFLIAKKSGLPWSEFLEIYLRVVVTGILGTFLDTFFAITAHQQNGLVEFDENFRPKQLVYRESFGGVYACQPLVTRPMYDPFGNSMVSFENILNDLFHVLIRAHLIPLADLLEIKDLSFFRSILEDEFAKPRSLSPELIAIARHKFLVDQNVPRIALMYMRNVNAREPIFFEAANELLRDKET
jgi:hypothetical protein